MSDKQYLDYEGLARVAANMVTTFAPISHNHDDRYYTESEINSKVSTLNASIASAESGAVASAKEYTDGQMTSLTEGDVTVANATTAENCSGNAATASKLATAHKITLSGDASGSITFDGSADKTLTVTVADDSHSHVIANVDGLQTALDGKAASSHTHDDRYYTETEINAKLDAITGGDIVVGEATHAGSATNDGSGNSIVDTYETKTDAAAKLAEAKSYADGVKDDLLNGAGTAYDTLKELGDLIDTNVDAIDALETVAASKADASALTAHTGNGDIHVTAAQKTNWNTAYTHSQAAHAPSNAEKNQNAFSNVTVGTTTIAADTATDTLTLVAGSNVTLTPDATNDKITIAATDTKSFTITAAASDDDVVVLTGTNGTNKVTYSASHANSGVTAGTYKSVTVDAKGHVTAGSNPTTLAGYGITDAAAKSHTHSDYVNQNAFGKVTVGSTTIEADAAVDTLTLVAGSNVTITPDATNDKITIAAKDTVYTHPSSGVTAGSYGLSANATPAHGTVAADGTTTTAAGSFKVPYFTVNAAGHITSASAQTVTLPTITSISNDTIDTLFANLNA